jgi:4-amino-4-deoxy-L-arabinose transferase-like glycosyltransferase
MRSMCDLRSADEELMHRTVTNATRKSSALSACSDFASRFPRRRAFVLCGWVLIIVTLVAVRWVLIKQLPFYLWSKDAGSYADSAWQWLDTGRWETDPRRGPVYSLLIALCLKLWGTFWSLMLVQHLLCAVTVLAAIGILWRLHGAAAWLPLAACSVAYALYAGPIAAAHIVRNESLIFLFATVSLAAWFEALRKDSLPWLCLTGLAFGLLVLTKNVFAPLPLVIVAAIAWLGRNRPGRAGIQLCAFLAMCVAPLVGNRVLTAWTVHEQPTEPQAGLLFYARVAQFTPLDHGLYPELKQMIRSDIEEYRKRPKLDNNIILNRTAIPRLRTYLLSIGKTPADLNRICRQLAFEAIRGHPTEYARQFWRDFSKLHLSYGERLRRPDRGEFEFTTRWLGQMERPHPTLHRAETLAAIKQRDRPETFRLYQKLVDGAWLFNCSPVLLTSLALPVMTFLGSGRLRWWWFALCTVWYFNMILLSTVGKPMDRYLIPVMPVMIWTLGSIVVLLFQTAVHIVALALRRDHLVTRPAL